MVEFHLRWFGHVWKRPIEVPVKRVDQMGVVQQLKIEEDLKKIIGETVDKDNTRMGGG